jgi:hypothetical protein
MEDWGLNTKLKSGGYLLIRLKQWFSTFWRSRPHFHSWLNSWPNAKNKK